MPNTVADSALLQRAEDLIARLERLLVPAAVAQPAWDGAIAFRWRPLGASQGAARQASGGMLHAVPHPHRIRLADLQGIDEQKKIIERNTRQFLAGRPANNVLLTGARGTGKSSLVKALLNQFARQGLRLIEIEKRDLGDLPDILDLIYDRPERFILFCDDLSFTADEAAYPALKAILDGSIASRSDNLLVYATSNRRHLMPESMQDNVNTKHIGDEVHPDEAIEEKISLSDRFGIWLSFYSFDQAAYLDIVDYWAAQLGDSASSETRHRAALQWALERGARSGRVAWQFARDWAGAQGLKRAPKR